jgi:hypothetical protein
MASKLAWTGIAAAVLAGTVLAGALPAQAQARPRVAYGHENVIDYYNNAQHSTLVGQLYQGSCGGTSWGTFTAYSTLYQFTCPS